jgi:Rrf2 family protein
MALLAASGERSLTNKEMADSLDASGAHLSKVLQRLGKLGYVRAVRGPKGGFFLAKPAEEITLLEIHEAIDGPMGVSACLFGQPVCRGDNCVLGGLIHAVGNQVKDHLAKTRVSELAPIFVEKQRIRQAHPQ